jgi:hypothetical protein
LVSENSGANVSAVSKQTKHDPLRKANVTDEHREEARRLRALWDQAEHRPSQEKFGELYKIGNQSAVGQFLRGESPLSLKAAMGFAQGLGRKISEFSPRLAQEAAALQAVAPAKKTVMSLVDLNELEMQLVLFYRGISPDHQAELLQHANKLYVKDNPGQSRANPYPAPIKVKEET